MSSSPQKRCASCKLSLSLESFNKAQRRFDGKQTTCKECNKKNARRYYRENKPTLLPKILKAKKLRHEELLRQMFDWLVQHPCVDCGESDPSVLDFDHREDEEKQINISKALQNGWSWSNLSKEMNKCDVRCANCHRRRTARLFNWYTERLKKGP